MNAVSTLHGSFSQPARGFWGVYHSKTRLQDYIVNCWKHPDYGRTLLGAALDMTPFSRFVCSSELYSHAGSTTNRRALAADARHHHDAVLSMPRKRQEGRGQEKRKRQYRRRTQQKRVKEGRNRVLERNPYHDDCNYHDDNGDSHA